MTHETRSSAVVSAGNTWTQPVRGSGVVVVGALRADGIVGDLCGTCVTVQGSPDGISWTSAMTITSSGEYGLPAAHGMLYRAGVAEGEYGSCDISVSVMCDAYDCCTVTNNT